MIVQQFNGWAIMKPLINMDLLDKAHRLEQAGQSFVLAFVVRAEKPTSAKAGAHALLRADGKLEGWIGGSCAEPTVRREALKALQDGRPRLLRLCPPEKIGQLPQEGVIETALTCISGGTLEIYLEPHLAQPHLLVIGHLATSEALVRMGKALNYRVSLMGLEATQERFPEADQVYDNLDFSRLDVTPNTYIVVASHGNYDEEALEAALASRAGYVSLVASPARGQALLQYLRDSGLAKERIDGLKIPAGLDIGAQTPEEIALSILAEIVQLSRRSGMDITAVGHPAELVQQPASAVDPVCGMQVDIPTARYTSHYQERVFYFCARSCQHAFEQDPENYLTKEGSNAI